MFPKTGMINHCGGTTILRWISKVDRNDDDFIIKFYAASDLDSSASLGASSKSFNLY